MNWSCIRKSIGTAVLLGASLGASAAAPISVTITPADDAAGNNGGAVVNVTVTNHSASPLRVLKWDMPFENMQAPLFEVTRNGQQARYLGMRPSHGAPAAADYLELAPGASRSARVNLASLYEMSTTGAYTVRYHADSPLLLEAAGMQSKAGELQSAAVSIWVDGQQTFSPDP